MVFVVEKRRVTVCFEQKVLAELARHLRTRSFAGGHEKRPEALCFVKKIHVERVFLYKTEGLNDNFRSKEKGRRPWAHRESASAATLQIQVTLSL